MSMVRGSRGSLACIFQYLERFRLSRSHPAGEYSMGTFNDLVTGQTNPVVVSEVNTLTFSSSVRGSVAERSSGCSISRRK